MRAKQKSKVYISWWLTLLELLLVRYVRISDEWIEQVRQAALNGPVVFILRNRSLIDFICLRGLCTHHGLPQVGFVSGLAPFVFLPLWRWIFALFSRRTPERQLHQLTDTLKNGGSAVVFLRRPSLREAMGSRLVKNDGIRLTVETQEQLQSPVQALPTVFLWGENSMHRMPRTMDFMLGTAEYPRLLRSIWLLIRRRAVHGSWLGEPIDLNYLRTKRSVDNAALSGIVRAGIGRRIEQIRRARLGSLTKPSSRIKTEVINSKKLCRELESITENEEVTASDITHKTRSIINAMATHFRPSIITLFSLIMTFIWRRIYSGFDISQEDRDAIRDAVGKGPLLILPSHKSHVDYMAVSQVMADSNIMLPHIAAGENLSFWPMGWLFRSSGAFFIRRKFINDRFYSAVVNSYVRRLIQSGYAIEVFIEGGRSRTGKLLRPKLGLLEMTLKACADTPMVNLGVLPVFLGYEKVIEEGSYVKESEGLKKRTENMGGLLKTTGVLLHKYGHLTVRTGNYFTIQTILDDMGYSREDLKQGNIRRMVALKTAMHTLHEINRISVATPTSILSAAALLIPEQQFRWSKLRSTVEWMTDFLNVCEVPISKIAKRWLLNTPKKDHLASVDSTISAFIKGGRIKISKKGDNPLLEIKDGRRLPLDYYKNNIIHFFVPSSIICVTCLSCKESGASLEKIGEDLELACHLYRWEFLLPDHKDETGLFKEQLNNLLTPALNALIKADILVKNEKDRFTINNHEKALFIRDFLRNFYEPYYATLYIARERNLGNVTGETMLLSKSHMESGLVDRIFLKPEGANRLNMQNAFQACKDLRLNRPTANQRPFDDGEIGDRLLNFLERALESSGDTKT